MAITPSPFTRKAACGTVRNSKVPAALANLAVAVVPDDAIDEALSEVQQDVEPYLPMLQDLGQEFYDAPDFEIVRVENGDETVLIEKLNGHLWVRVDGRDDRVQIRVPVKTIRAVTRLLDRA